MTASMQPRGPRAGDGAPTYAALERRARALGLAVRGAFHPAPDALGTPLPGVRAATVVLLGFTGRDQWDAFCASPEARDGLADPLDRWSQRVIGGLAAEFGAHACYPSGTPRLPFQRYARLCEPVHPSPLGLLIHPRYGLWHAYRGLLVLPEPIALPERVDGGSPCTACARRPCLSGCPVSAYTAAGFDVERCIAHVASAAGAACVTQGCRARAACPVGTEHRYGIAQQRFHMQAFVAACTG